MITEGGYVVLESQLRISSGHLGLRNPNPIMLKDLEAYQVKSFSKITLGDNVIVNPGPFSQYRREVVRAVFSDGRFVTNSETIWDYSKIHKIEK